MIEITPKQSSAIQARLTAKCTVIRIERSAPMRRAVDVSTFDRQRLIETVRVEPGGGVKVLS